MRLNRIISRGRVDPRVAATVVLIGVLAPPGAAQRRPPGMFQEKFEPRPVLEPYSGSGVYFEWDSEQDQPGDIGARIVTGTVGAIAGAYLGFYAGYALETKHDYDSAVIGAVLGSGILSALATRVPKGGGGGSLGKNLLVSGVALGIAYGTGVQELVLVAPMLHVAFAVH